MKKLMFLALLLIVAFAAQAQQDYRPWKDFEGDTLRYLKANFEDNKNRYIGQPFERVINDYELPLKECNLIAPGRVVKVRFSYLDDVENVEYWSKGKTMHILLIHLKDPVITVRPLNFTQQPDGSWKQERDMRLIAMKIKDCIVENIEVVTYPQ